MLRKLTVAAALTLASTAAFADNKIGVMYIPNAELELDDGNGFDVTLDGDGFGVFGKFDVADNAFITAEYTAVNYDEVSGRINGISGSGDIDADFDQLRVGFGGSFALSNPQLSTLLHLEIIDFDFEDDSETGVGIHTGLTFAATPNFDIYGQVGYLKIDDVDGPELKFGINFQTTEQFSLFADYRSSLLDADGGDFELQDFRVGAALHF